MQRLHAREQLGEGERLRQIVVAAGLQSAARDRPRCGGAQDEHGRADALAAQLLDDAQAVAARQHDVDDGDVVRLGRRQVQALIAVGRVIDREAFARSPFSMKVAIVGSSSMTRARTEVRA